MKMYIKVEIQPISNTICTGCQFLNFSTLNNKWYCGLFGVLGIGVNLNYPQRHKKCQNSEKKQR